MHEYSNNEIKVKWDSKKCFHSEVCIKNLPGVFDTNRKPWIVPANGDSKSIAETIEKCPSGALSYELKNESPETNIADEKITEIYLLRNGPLKIRGKVKIIDSDGSETIKEGTFSLCRCGGSQNKPFCDGTHNKNNFLAD